MKTFIFFILASLYCASCLDNGLGLTPPMGFSTWNSFAGNINETLIKEIADAFIEKGLDQCGYSYINIDDGWAVGRDANGVIIPDAKIFPSGFKALADYVHSKGLKIGIYTARGDKTCLGRPGSSGYEKLDALTYANWGFDYLKEDSCSGYPNISQWDQFALMRDALNATGRPIYFSICEFFPRNNTPYHGVYTVLPWGPIVQTLANSWLVETVNMADTFEIFMSNFDAQSTLTSWNYSGVGGWNDPDMMSCCMGGMTNTEYRALFSLWSIMAAPLILGNDVRKATDACLQIICNKEVIAIDQDKLGIQGHILSQSRDNTTQVLGRPLQDGSYAVVLFNRGTKPTMIGFTWELIGLDPKQFVHIRDLWAHADVGYYKSSYSVTVQSHEAIMLRLYKVKY